MIVNLLPDAITDLEAIGDYIARDNPIRALSFVQELHTKCSALGTMPFAFPLVPRYEHTGVRHHVHGSYQIFYRIMGEPQRIDVIHIVHGKRNYAAILFP